MGEYSALPQRLQLWFVFTIWGHVCQLASMASNLAGIPEGATEATEVNYTHTLGKPPKPQIGCALARANISFCPCSGPTL